MVLIYISLYGYMFIAGYMFGLWYNEHKATATTGAVIAVMFMSMCWLPVLGLTCCLIALGYVVEFVSEEKE